jgi:threonylcarbamoyladenosine tRNA methylthiotransferase CDKAL1
MQTLAWAGSSCRRKIVSIFRRAHPSLTLMADVIVGYPTESWEDFEDTCRLIEKVERDFVSISRFYPWPGTPAAKLKQLPADELNRRSKILSDLCGEIKRTDTYNLGFLPVPTISRP